MKLFNLIEFAPIELPLKRRLQTLAVMTQINLFLHLPALAFILTLFSLLFSPFFWIPISYAIWYYLDHIKWNRSERGGRFSMWVRDWTIWKYFCSYFPISLVKTVDLDPKKNYLFCVSPHGVMAHGIFGNFATNATGFCEKFPGITPHLLTLAEQFVPPFDRELFLFSGACSASSKSMKYILNNEGRCKSKGQAAILLVGGAAESMESFPGRYRLVLRKRKGFVRIALETGCSLVPVFSFGENDLYSAVLTQEGSWMKKIQNTYKKTFHFGMPIIWGRGVFNYSFGIMPYRKEIHTVVGKPIDVPKIAYPTQEQIDQWHELYLNELTKLFNEHKAEYLVDKTTVLELL